MLDWKPYLQSVCATYAQWWEVYTLTDVVGKNHDSQVRKSLLLDLQAIALKPEAVKPEKELLPEAREKREILNVLEGLRKYAPEHVLLIGRPGSGKSTALARLLLEEAQFLIDEGEGETKQTSRNWRFNNVPIKFWILLLDTDCLAGILFLRKIPILVELRYYQTSIIDLIKDFLHRHDPSLAIDGEAVKILLRQGQFLLLLDGVNELPSSQARRDLQKFRQDFQKTTPMIFTTRDLGVGGDLEISKKLEMQPLTETQMRDFVRGYLPEVGEQMLKQLGDRLRKFGETPLLLIMLCSVFASNQNNLPPNLGSVFRSFTEIYDHQLKQDVPISQESRRWWKRLLQHLAWVMMGGNPNCRDVTCNVSTSTEFLVAISRQQAEEIFTEFLEGKVNCAADCAIAWLDDLLKHHLIQLGAENKIEFSHQLIQEYYAAERFLQEVGKLSDDELQWDYLNYLKWTEPIALMSGLLEDESQVIRLVRLALEIDWKLGARLVKIVKQQFQQQPVIFIILQNKIPLLNKIVLLGEIGSDYAIPYLYRAFQYEYDSLQHMVITALRKIGTDAVIPILSQKIEEKIQKISSGLYQVLHDKHYNLYEKYDLLNHAYFALINIDSSYIISALNQLLNSQYLLFKEITALYLLQKQRTTINIISYCNILINILLSYDNYAVVYRCLRHLYIFYADCLFRWSQDIKELINNLDVNLILVIIDVLNKQLKSDSSDIRCGVVSLLDSFSTEKVISAFKEKNFQDRYPRTFKKTLKSLDKINNENIVPLLIQATNDESDEVRQEAIKTLGKFNNKDVIARLGQLLRSEDSKIRKLALDSLEKIGGEDIVPVLYYFIQDTISSLRLLLQDENFNFITNIENELIGKAFKLLEDIDNITSANIYHDLLNDEEDLFHCLATLEFWQIASLDIEMLIDAFCNVITHKNYSVATNVISDFRKFKIGERNFEQYMANFYAAIRDSKKIIAALIKVINNNNNSEVRIEAVKTLATFNNQEVISILSQVLNDDDSEVRIEAVRALAIFNNQEVISILSQVLNDDDSEVRIEAVRALATFDNQEVISTLSQALNNDDSEVRIEVIKALTNFDVTEVIPTLEKALHDNNFAVRRSAFEAIIKFDSEYIVPILSQIIEHTSQILPQVLSNHELDLLYQEEWCLCRDAALELQKIGSTSAIIVLQHFLQSQQELIHALSAFQLWKLNILEDDVLAAALLQLFHHDNPNLRKAAIEGLLEVKSDELMNVIFQAINDENEQVRIKAVHSFRNAKSFKDFNAYVIILILIQYLEDENYEVRVEAVWGLGYYNNQNEDVVSAIHQALHDKNYQVRKEAIRALSKLGDSQVIAALIQVLNDENQEVLIAAIKELSSFQNDNVVIALQKHLDNNNQDVCKAAIESLISIGNQFATELLFNWLTQNKNSELCNMIIDYLNKDYQNLSFSFIYQALMYDDFDVHKAAIKASKLVDDPKLLPYLYMHWANTDREINEQWDAIESIQKSCKYYKPAPIHTMSNILSHNYALLIGVGECEEPKLSLPVTLKDIQALKILLTDQNLCGYIDNDQHLRLLCNATATSENILDGLNWLKQQAENDPEATIFIYYSGHGCLDESGDYYLIPHETDRVDIPNTALSATKFNAALQQIPAKRLLVIIDSCHAQGMAASKDNAGKNNRPTLPKGFTQTALPKNIINELKQGTGRVVFTSSTGKQSSYIRPDDKMSVYTYHLLEALQGAANQPGDKVVRVSHLMNYLGKTVPETAQQLCKAEQTPFFDFATEDFPVALLRGGKGLPIEGWDEVKTEAQEKIRSISNQVNNGVGIVGDRNLGINIGTARNITFGDISSG